MNYILSQIFVVLGYICLGLTYLNKNRMLILFVGLGSLIFNGLSYIFLGAWMGLGVTCVAIVRNILFLIQQKIKALNKYKIDDWIILIFLLVISVVIAIFTYDTFFSLFSVGASVTYTLSVWQKNIKVYKILGIFSSLFAVIYFSFIGSLFGIILECVMFVVSLVATILYIKQQNKETNEQLVWERCSYGKNMFRQVC